MQVLKSVTIFIFILFVAGCQKDPVVVTPTKKIEPTPLKQNSKFVNHTVKKGETIYTISKEYKTSMVDIMVDNNLSRNQDVLVGRILKIRTAVDVNNYQEIVLLKNKITPLDDRPKETNNLDNVNPAKGKHFSGNIPYMLIPKGDGYQKSIKGIISKNFQDNHFGRPLLGLEIKSNAKQNVKAIHNGVVAFIAENFAGYGRCIAVATGRNEIFFMYGLNSITVKNGDVVNIGDSIGTINAGEVLGLKILHKGIFQDPGKLIPGMQ